MNINRIIIATALLSMSLSVTANTTLIHTGELLAIVESFCASLKRERCRRQTYKIREEAKADIFNYIEQFYNRKRSHTYLGYLNPVQYENRSLGLN